MIDNLIDGIGIVYADDLVTPTNAATVETKLTTYASLVAAFPDVMDLPPIRATNFNGRTICFHNLN